MVNFVLPAAPLKDDVPWEVLKVPIPIEPAPAAPSIVMVPEPILFRLNEVDVWFAEPKRPENVKLVLSKPALKVAPVPELFVTKAEPVMEPITAFTPLMSSVPALPRTMRELRESPLVAPARRVPSLTVVSPV